LTALDPGVEVNARERVPALDALLDAFDVLSAAVRT